MRSMRKDVRAARRARNQLAAGARTPSAVIVTIGGRKNEMVFAPAKFDADIDAGGRTPEAPTTGDADGIPRIPYAFSRMVRRRLRDLVDRDG